MKSSIDGCYTRQGLIERGWTLALIKKLLPKPDFIKRGRADGRGHTVRTYLWIPLKVIEREKMPEFQNRRHKQDLRIASVHNAYWKAGKWPKRPVNNAL